MKLLMNEMEVQHKVGQSFARQRNQPDGHFISTKKGETRVQWVMNNTSWRSVGGLDMIVRVHEECYSNYAIKSFNARHDAHLSSNADEGADTIALSELC